MGLISRLRVWANSGTREAYSDAKIDTGWVVAEPPIARSWNERSFARDTRINFVFDGMNAKGTCPPQMSGNDLCAGGVTSQWARPTGAPNYLSLGGTVRDSAVGWSDTDELPHLLILFDDNTLYRQIGCWDYESSPYLSSALSLAYPSTPDEVCAICADSTHIYAMWYVTSGNYYVSKFDAVTLAEVWSADLGYSSTPGADGHMMIHASSSYLAVSLDHFGFTDPERLVVIINKSTGAVTSGSGSWTSGYGDNNRVQNAKIVSDGTRVYWISSQDNAPTDRTFYLQCALISDPTSAGGYSPLSLGTLSATGWAEWPTGILRLGAHVVIATAEGKFMLADPAASGGSGALYEIFTVPADFVPYATGGNAYDVDLSFDGLSVWARMLRADSSSAQDTMFMRIPAGEFTSRAEYLTTPERWFTACHMDVNTAVATYRAGRMHFDGRDMWFIRRGGASYRITNPGAR